MKYEPPSKLDNSQVPPTEITLADLHVAVRNVQGLGKTRRRDLLSSIVRIGTITGRELNQIPLNPDHLKRMLEQDSPGTVSLSRKSLQNLRSDLAAAIAVSGLAKILRTAKLALLPEWKAHLDLIEDRGIRMALSRFARFCSALGIPPLDVQDTVFESFLVELEAGSLVRNPGLVHRQAVWAWNKACRMVPNFPGRPVTPAQIGRAPQGIAWEKLLPSFTADLAAWEQWGAVTDPYHDDARSRALKRSTLLHRRNHVRSAITMAIAQGTRVEDIRSLADLVELSIIKSIFRGFHAKNGGTANSYVSSMATTLITLAKEWVKVPESQLSELKRLRSKITKLDSGLTQKNKATLLRLDSPDAIARLLDLPQKLWAFAQSAKCPKKRRLPLAQTALMLEFLLNVPLRLANVASLSFDRHISWPAGAKGKAWLLIPGSETKTGQAYEAELGGELVCMLKTYRDKIVPKLTGKRHHAIFIDIRGRQKLPTTIADLFTATTRKHLGFPVTPHQMRHIAGKLLLDAEPGAFELVKQLLGHSNLKTTVAFYTGLDTSRAVRHHNKLIEETRANRGPKRGKGGKVRRPEGDE